MVAISGAFRYTVMLPYEVPLGGHQYPESADGCFSAAVEACLFIPSGGRLRTTLNLWEAMLTIAG